MIHGWRAHERMSKGYSVQRWKRVHGWIGRECRVYGGEPVKRSWGKT